MKHALKIILPLVLIIAILVAACWFFLFYRTDLTMSVFAYWGDHYSDAGRYNRAISMYKIAAKLAPDSDKLPVLLADAKPVIEYLEGWKCDISGIRRWEDLPEAARKYVEYVEEKIGCPIRFVSVGPERDSMIYR